MRYTKIFKSKNVNHKAHEGGTKHTMLLTARDAKLSQGAQ